MVCIVVGSKCGSRVACACHRPAHLACLLSIAAGRSLEHVELAAEPGGPLGEGSAFPISPELRFSLEHRADLLEAASKRLDTMCCFERAALSCAGQPMGMQAALRNLCTCGCMEGGLCTAKSACTRTLPHSVMHVP